MTIQRQPREQVLPAKPQNPLASIKPVASMYTPSLTYTYPGRLDLDLIKPIDIDTPASFCATVVDQAVVVVFPHRTGNPELFLI